MGHVCCRRVRMCRARAGVTLLTLPGTHITPCGGELPWPTGPVFGPADTIVQVGATCSILELLPSFTEGRHIAVRARSVQLCAAAA
jgi:hypothetical protein